MPPVTGWARIKLAALGLAGAVAALVSAELSARIHYRENPTGVPSFLANSPYVQIAINDALLTANAAGANKPQQSAGQMRTSLRGDPLDAAALRQMGGLAERTGQARQAELLQRTAEQISRRDAMNQLTLLELASQQGSVSEALSHIDRVLKVHWPLSQLILPVLDRGIEESAIRSALSGYADRPWYRFFLVEEARTGANATFLPDLFAHTAPRLSSAERRSIGLAAAAELVRRELIPQARAIGRLASPQFQSVATDLRFNAATIDTAMGPLAWQFAGGADARAFLEGTTVQVEVMPERTAAIASRATLLWSGSHEIVWEIAGRAGTSDLRLDLRGTCSRSGLEFAKAELRAGSGRQPFNIPAGCPAQQWTVNGTAPPGQLSSQAEITRLALEE